MEFYAERVERVTCSQCGCAFETAQAKPLGTMDCPQCGTPVRIPARFDEHFLITQVLGKGTSGTVFKAFDEQLHRQVAIKVLRKGSDEEEKIALECIREARALAAINDPGIIQIYSIGKYRDQHYIVMELGTKGRADKYLSAQRKLDEAQVLEMGMSVAGGLAAAARVGLVHMDVKPGNILLASGRKAKLIDFGAAQYAQRDRQVEKQKEGEAGKAIIGTPYYIAPEVVRGKEPDEKADIYSLGATLFHLLTGRPPFPGHRPMDVMQQRLKRPAPWVLDLRDDLHPETAQVIAKMLATDPKDRYQDYRQLTEALREAHAAAMEGPVDALEAQLTRLETSSRRRTRDGEAREAGSRSDSIDQPPRRKPKSGLMQLAAILGVILALAGGVYLLIQNLQPDYVPPPPPPPPVEPVNNPPVAVAPKLTLLSVTPTDEIVGQIEGQDPDPGDQLSYEVLTQRGVPALLSVDRQGQLRVADSEALRKQAGETVTVRVIVRDNADPPGEVVVDVPVTINAPDVRTYQLVAHWPLKKDGADATGNGHDGKLIGQPKFVQSQAGYPAVQFNGNDAIAVPHDPALTSDDMTVACWVRIPKKLRQKADAGLVTKGPDSWCLELNGLTAGQFRFSLGPAVRVVTAAVYYNDGEWHHLVAVKRGTGLWLFVDGLQAGRSETMLPKVPTNKQALWIGGNAIDPAKYGLRGHLSDVRLYSRALDPSEVKKLYELTRAGDK